VKVNQEKREAMKIAFKTVVFALSLRLILSADVTDQTLRRMTLVREEQADGWWNR
jgi:hypothetical protein